MRKIVLGSVALCLAGTMLMACAPAESTSTSVAAQPQAGVEADAEAAPQAAAPAAAATTVGGTRACMIAGTFEILGQKLRSRDCLQAGPSVPEAEHRKICEGLAQSSAQLGGGKAGELTYMDTCPSPSQGVCKGIFLQDMEAHYYERPADQLPSLPDSCRMGGATWVPAA